MSSTPSIHPFLLGYLLGAFLMLLLMILGVVTVPLKLIVITIGLAGLLMGFVTMILDGLRFWQR